MRNTSRIATAAAAGVALALTLAGPAAATVENPPNATVTSYGCEIQLVLDNTGPYSDGIGHDGPWFAAFDWRLPGDPQLAVEPELDGLSISDPPLAPQPFDGLYNPVPVLAGETVTVDVTAEPGTAAVEVRLVRGAEQRVFWDWTSYPINCPPEPTPSPSPSPSVTPTPTPEASQPAASPSASAAAPPAGVAGSSLPLTGVGTGTLATVALLLLAAGGGLYLATRRRRPTFTAE
jgi:LPXTG-motif cell wall-anchored protein